MLKLSPKDKAPKTGKFRHLPLCAKGATLNHCAIELLMHRPTSNDFHRANYIRTFASKPSSFRWLKEFAHACSFLKSERNRLQTKPPITTWSKSSNFERLNLVSYRPYDTQRERERDVCVCREVEEHLSFFSSLPFSLPLSLSLSLSLSPSFSPLLSLCLSLSLSNRWSVTGLEAGPLEATVQSLPKVKWLLREWKNRFDMQTW